MDPITKPTARRVAEMLTDGDNDYHDGNDWRVSLKATGNVVDIVVTPTGEDCETALPERRFRAYVVSAEDRNMHEAPEPTCDLSDEISGFAAASWLWHYKQQGAREPIAYFAQLMVLISIADADKRTGLAVLYPGLVGAFELAKAGRFDELRTIAESVSWEGW